MAGTKHVIFWMESYFSETGHITAAELVKKGYGKHHSVLCTLKQLVENDFMTMSKSDYGENQFSVNSRQERRFMDEPYLRKMLNLAWKYLDDPRERVES